MKITISGRPGSGKGIVREILEKKYRTLSFSVGDLRREFAKSKGMSIQQFNEYSEKNPQGDLEADKYQREWASKKENFILEGRLSYYFIPESIKIYLTGNPLVLAKRIIDARRDTEQIATSPLQQAKLNAQRCESDNRRYFQNYGIKNCYDPENFDIVIDTTHKSVEEVVKLVDKKIIDYNQKMFPPKFYLGHPTESKAKIRDWEKGFEQRTGIELVNPFFDPKTLESALSEMGKEKYLKMGKRVTELYRQDLEQIARKDILGGVIILDENWTWGTPAEQATLWLLSKLIYTVTLHPEKNYSNHPVVQWYSTKTFKSLESMENYLVRNKNKLYRELEKTRQRNLKNPTHRQLIKEIKNNERLSSR